MKFKMILVWLVLLFVAVPVVADNANSPWQLLNGGFDSTIRGAWLLALPDLAAEQGVFKLFQDSALFMGSDGGGVSRSVLPLGANANDFGKNWEMVNGGRGVSDSVCGGYGDLMASSPICGANADPTAHTPLIYGGPPSALQSYDVSAMASGGWPASILGDLPTIAGLSLAPDNSAARATGVVYRITGSLHVSPDAGRQWFPLAPQCSLNNLAGYHAIAVDAGQPGHVVVAATEDAGGCMSAVNNPCRVRQIAWTNDVGPQISKSIQSTSGQPGAPTPRDIDFEGHGVGADYAHGWRFSMISHLVRKNLKAVTDGAECAYLPGGDANGVGNRLPINNACEALPGVTVCHAWKVAGGDNKAEQSCPDAPACVCSPIGKDPLGGTVQAELDYCDSPHINDLSIDPRNGFVYANTQAGLLLSRDSGRIWERFGAGGYTKWSPTGFEPVVNQTEVKSPLAGPNAFPSDRGAKLLTRQGLYVPEALFQVCENAGPFCASDLASLDLNAQPEYIESISALGQSWQACPGGADAPKYANGRTRGELVATVAVTWHNPMKPAQILSGVFVAAQIDNCSPSANPLPPPGALVFRDTANVIPTNSGYLFQAVFGGVAGNDNYQWRWDSEALMDGSDPPKPYLKLPRFMNHPDSGDADVDRCRMNYLAAAVAPSDSRVL